jgi:uncharacterized protein YbcI
MNYTSRRQLASLYNEINKEIFSRGVHDQKIDIVDNKVIILARTKRLPALNGLEGEHSELVLALDSALSSRYKKRLKEKLEFLFDINVTFLFRDYDPHTEQSCAVIYFDKRIDQ